jgi:hypothetical protein
VKLIRKMLCKSFYLNFEIYELLVFKTRKYVNALSRDGVTIDGF